MTNARFKKLFYIYRLILITIIIKMKKIRFFFVITAVASLAAYVFFGCKDKDKVAPLIFINGSNPYTTILEEPYDDSLAVAEDNLDGTLTGSLIIGHNIPKKKITGVTDSVTSKVGVYEVNYTATDKAGNQKISIRTVYVKNWAWPYEVPYTVYRKKAVPSIDSVGCQYWKYYPYRTVVQKYNIAADKVTNKKILIPLGGEIKIKVDGFFVDAVTNPLRIQILTQDVWGIKGWNGTIVDTARMQYRVSGVNLTGSDHSASYVDNQLPGHLKLIIKYSINKILSTTPAVLLGPTVIYTDTLNQRF